MVKEEIFCYNKQARTTIKESTEILEEYNEGGSLLALIIQKSYNESEEKWILVLEGEVDLHTADRLKETVNQMLNERVDDIRIIGDRLEYIDSTGLSVFISALKKLQTAEKNIILANLKPSIKKLLNITGLDRLVLME